MSIISQPRGILKKAGETTLSNMSFEKKGRRESKVTMNEPLQKSNSKKGLSAIPENAIKEAKEIKTSGTKTAIIKREIPISEPGTISASKSYVKAVQKKPIQQMVASADGLTEISNTQNILISESIPKPTPNEVPLIDHDEKYNKEMELYKKNPDMYKKPEKVKPAYIPMEYTPMIQPKIEFRDLEQIEHEIVVEKARLDYEKEDRILQILERQREILFDLVQDFNRKEKLKKRKKLKLLTRKIDEITKMVDNSDQADNLMDEITGLLRGEKEQLTHEMMFRQDSQNPLDFYRNNNGSNFSYGPGYNQDYMQAYQNNGYGGMNNGYSQYNGRRY